MSCTSSPLLYRLDRTTNTVTLPDVDLGAFDMARAITMRAACKMLRGRVKRRVLHGQKILNVTRLSVDVARRWANRKRGWKVKLAALGGPVEIWTMYLPAVKVGGELLTMPEWVQAFERARARLSVGLPAPA